MSELSSVSIDRVKVLILGDSGVGKTTLVQLIATGHALPRGPGWTAGCSVEVRYHEYAAGTPREKPYFVELWDIGGCQVLQAVRPLFYGGAHGYILVHDMTNRKSLEHLKTVWLAELNEAAQSVATSASVTSSPWSSPSLPSSNNACLLPPQAPCLLIGTKLDSLTTGNGDSDSYLPISSHLSSGSPSAWPGLGVSITAESISKTVGGAEHITVDCHNSRSLAPGSSNAVAISRFFDKVIDAKLSQTGNLGGTLLSSSYNSNNHFQNSSTPTQLPSSSLLTSAGFASRLSGGGTSPFQQSSLSGSGLAGASRDRHRMLLK